MHGLTGLMGISYVDFTSNWANCWAFGLTELGPTNKLNYPTTINEADGTVVAVRALQMQ